MNINIFAELANLDTPARVFTFLGFEVDIPKQIVRVPEKRKEKIRNLAAEILSRPICEFNQLEKLRGKLCSLMLVCPLTRLFIRQITHHLTLAENLLQPEVMLTPELMDEITQWVVDPYFLTCEREFNRIGEVDLDFKPKQTTEDGVIEYHTGTVFILKSVLFAYFDF